MNTASCYFRLDRILTILILPLVFSFSVSAQLLDTYQEKYWLRPELATDSIPQTYIANYHTLDLSQPQHWKQLRGIAHEKFGTLFLVLKNSGNHSSDEPLLHLGQLVVYRDRVVLDGKETPIDTITEEASILRLSFQTRQGQRSQRPLVRVSKQVEASEIIFYPHLLKPQEWRVVESYLAMKYSVNITENDDPEFRDYLDIFKDRVWSHRMDGLYNEEVLALGRLDTIGFFQSQTFTSDSRSIRLSLQPEGEPGTMPEVYIEDNSLLILSRKKWNAAQRDCGDSPLVNAWKLRLINWKSGQKHLYLTLDTVLDVTQRLVLTDGTSTIALPVVSGNGSTQLDIPLDSIDPTGDLYLAISTSERECQLLAEVLIHECDVKDSFAHQVSIRLQPDALPATLNLVDLTSGEALQSTLNEPIHMINGLRKGQYQLTLTRDNRILSDKVFRLSSCAGNPYISGEEFEVHDSSSWQLSTIPGNGPVDWNSESVEVYLQSLSIDPSGHTTVSQKGIVVFPNPGSRSEPMYFRFAGLQNVPFTVQIYDSKGMLIDQTDFTPEGHTSDFQFQFKVDGSYFVKFISASYSETRHVRIKSNLH